MRLLTPSATFFALDQAIPLVLYCHDGSRLEGPWPDFAAALWLAGGLGLLLGCSPRRWQSLWASSGFRVRLLLSSAPLPVAGPRGPSRGFQETCGGAWLRVTYWD